MLQVVLEINIGLSVKKTILLIEVIKDAIDLYKAIGRAKIQRTGTLFCFHGCSYRFSVTSAVLTLRNRACILSTKSYDEY